ADLPCSGLGVMGHKVDIRYNITLSSIEDIISLQAEILESIHDLLKVNGEMVISTCTFNKDENERQVARFIANHPNYEVLEEATYLPYEYGTDGFYICKLRRNY
ncbi:MAG: 16S rRNA (cytosine(967)-C(5))-methyltransferase RsmB, partial [Bacilli bacterium]|nr:16S rRNA (cytosine(967)-C(5))-methyltransferase RsmB [Bacilli bacterium]